jgi:hypothetical protein
MANAIFILIGPGMRNHKSILEQLAYVDKIKIPSTADAKGPHGSALIATQATPYTNDLTGQSGWIISAVPFGHESLRSGRILSLLDWWNEGVLKGVGGTEVLTRLQVIRVMRDQDEGAHLDDHINDDTYIAVHLRGVGIQYKPSADSEEAIPVDGALEATIWQMSHEVLNALESWAISAQVMLSEAAKNGPLNTQFFQSEPEAPE